MSEKMSTERAAKILDPKHRESYESLAIVEEACQMGRDALLLRIPRSPYKKGFACPNCGSSDYLYGLLRQTEQVLRQLRAGHFVGG